MNDSQQTLSSPVMREISAPRRHDHRDDAHAAGEEARVNLSLNAGWQFWRDENSASSAAAADSQPPDGTVKWEQVNLPHSVRLEPVNASGGRNFQGICWYRRNLVLEHAWRDRIIYLHFEGAMQVAEIWLNGQKIATHFGGYTPFTLDISRHVDFSSANLLVVRLNNRDQPQVPPGKRQAKLDFTYFGGLYRNVRLVVMDRLHLTDPILADKTAGGGVFVRYEQVSDESADVMILAEVQNEHAEPRPCTIHHELIDSQGQIAAEATSERTIGAGAEETVESRLHVRSPRLWHPHSPNLYTLRTSLSDPLRRRAIDGQAIRIGIRHIRFDKDEGFFINGRKFLSIGANRHQDHPYVGYALPDSAHWRDARKLRDAGFTSVRCHYPQSPAFMDACDEMGILAIISNPGWQLLGDEVFRRRAIENARLMVRRDRNRPAAILWEAALNESDNGPIGAALQQAVHEEYPGDQCYTAGDHEPGFKVAGRVGWDVEFYRNDGSKPFWIREWGDHVDNWRDQQSPNRVNRGWGERPMLTQAMAHLRRMDEIMVSHHGTSSGNGARRLCGACLWAGIDHARGYHHQNFFGGALDGFRLPKFSYFLFQSQRPLAEGPMVFVANFASFLSPAEVTVFSNCEQVRLSRDGQVIEQRGPDKGHRVPHPPFTFQVGRLSSEHTTMFMSASGGAGADKPVELLAEGLIDGQVVAQHLVRPPGVATQVLLEADLCGYPLTADGADWVRIHARICDARGVLVPFADDQITFTVDGPGEWIGDASIGANPVNAAGGIATGLLRAGSSEGRILVRAAAFGLSPGTMEIVSERCRKIEGLIRNSSGPACVNVVD